MFNVLGAAQSLNALFQSPAAAKPKSVDGTSNLDNRSSQSSAQSFGSSKMPNAPEESLTTDTAQSVLNSRAKATNSLGQLFYGTGSRLDVYA